MFRFEIKVDLFPVLVKKPECEDKADRLADDRCQRRTHRTHFERSDKENVKNDIDDGSDGDELERMLGIAHTSEDCGDKVVSVDEDDSVYTGDRILSCVFINIGRCVEPVDNAFVRQQEDDHDDHSQAHQKREQSADHQTDLVPSVFTDISGNENLAGIGKSHGNESDQLQHFTAD